MSAWFAFWLVVLAVLVAYLSVSIRLRHRAMLQAERAQRRALEREFPPRTFDPSAITPGLRRVRMNYAAAARIRERPAFRQEGLMAAARQFIAHFAYFRRAKSAPELPAQAWKS